MHPTISQFLVDDRQATLRAEADHARLATIARGAIARAATPTRQAPRPARPGVIRRLVMRLGAA